MEDFFSNSKIFSGRVISGKGLGRRFGFPTVNLVFEKRPDLEYGVYAAYASLFRLFGDKATTRREKFSALVHFGPRPTIAEEKASFEVFFLKFPEALQEFSEGAQFDELEVEILGKIRDVMKFDSLEDLAQQIEKDREFAVLKYFS